MSDPSRTHSEMVARHAGILEELAEINMDLTRMVRQDVAASVARGEPVDRAELGLAAGRLSRAVRLSLALERRFSVEEMALAEKVKAKADAEAAALADAEERAAFYRSLVRNEKHEAIQIAKTMVVENLKEKGVTEVDTEDLFRDLNERIDDDSDLDVLAHYSLIDMVGLLCDQMGVPFERDIFKGDDDALRRDWLDDEPEPPPKPPQHPAWVKSG